jgi:formylglycine-generating enzyme required for sulfatase activity
MGYRHRDGRRDPAAIETAAPRRRLRTALVLCLATGIGCPPVPPGPPVGTMITVPGAGFEIDATEVTRAQYRLFLAAAVPLPTDEFCEWNTTHEPGCAWEGDGGDGDLPANCINWCNARDYCLWAGKRLCRDSWDDPKSADAEWLTACRGPDGLAYPYGNDYGGSTCNGIDYPKFPQARPVGSFPDCVGGWPRLHDMSGNVNEWVDACSPAVGTLAACRLRGGSFQDPAGNLDCAHDFGVHDSPTLDTNRIGFRCCRSVATGTGTDAGGGTGG